MKNINILTILLLITCSVFSQNKHLTVSGRVIEKDTKEPVVQANLQLFRLPDSTYVGGTASNLKGYFSFSRITAGKYVLKVSYVGLKNKVLPLVLSPSVSTHQVGTIH